MRDSPYILAVDLGTGGVKTVLFNDSFDILANAYYPYNTSYPYPSWAEQDPNDWWKGLRVNIKRILEISKIKPSQISVIGIDAMTPVVIPIDRNGEALRKAIIWMDRRAIDNTRFIERKLGEDLFKISGNHNDPSNFGPKVMWLKNNEPEVYKKTAFFHHANGYLISKITGVHTLDKTQCGLSQLCDTRLSKWSNTLLKGCGLNVDQFPEIYESTDVVGNVSENAARELGLAAGIPVIAGSMDNVAAGLGLGIHEPGELYISAGTATNVCLNLPQVNFDPSFHIYCHIVPNCWLTVAGVDFGGAGFKWFNELLGNTNYEELNHLVEKCRDDFTRPLLFLPYMVGQRAPIWNNDTRGVMFGLDPSMGRGELARSFMEGNAMGVNRILHLFNGMGYNPSSAKLTGGAAESSVYSQIFADVTGCSMEITGEKDVATLGIAMAAAYGAKIHSSFSDMIEKNITKKSVVPNPARHSYYKDAQELFNDLFQKLRGDFARLAILKRKHSI